MNRNPIEISPQKLASLHMSTTTKLRLGGLLGAAESGQTWFAPDGKRTVLYADITQVFYVLTGAKDPMQNGRIFEQLSTGFRDDVVHHPMFEASRRTAAVARLAEIEVQIMLGILAATSVAGFLAVLGMDAVEFSFKNRVNFPKWCAAIGACIAVRAVLKKHAPTLYDKLIDAALLSAAAGVADSARNIPDAALSDPKSVARAVGAVVGTLGKKGCPAG